MKNYLFAGASSSIAKATILGLDAATITVTGLSRQQIPANPQARHAYHMVSSYSPTDLPDIIEPLHGLVYFPGTITLKPFSTISPQQFLTDFDVNVIGAVNVIQKYLPNLKKAANASIVLVSSVAARTGMPYHTSIATAKAALEGFAMSLSAELAPAIRVNVVAPSLVKSVLSDKFTNTPEKLDNAYKRHPLKSIGQPEDIAAAITFLLSEDARWITGQVMKVDGGIGALRI